MNRNAVPFRDFSEAAACDWPVIVHLNMVLTLVLPDPPPTRTRPDRAADRHSPNALPLASAGEALVRANPAEFPLQFAGLVVVFGKTLPDVNPLGYQPEHAIIEVLTDVGAVVEPEGLWMRSSQSPSANFYVVMFHVEPVSQ